MGTLVSMDTVSGTHQVFLGSGCGQTRWWVWPDQGFTQQDFWLTTGNKISSDLAVTVTQHKDLPCVIEVKLYHPFCC